ncbi:MAG TPA: tetratricopeptide repeat protein, partial [Marinagarivorans sp.]
MAKNNAQPTQHSGFGALCRAAIIVGCGLTLSSASFALTLQDARLSIRTKQYKTAEQQLIELAKAGDSDAQYLLGSLYNSGQGVKRNYEKSAFWLTQAANQGDAKASYTLGVYYETGKGSTKNIEQAIEWYQKALEQGESKAEQRLAALKSSNALAPKAQSVSDLINLIRANDLFTLEKSLQTETQKGL